MKKLTYVIASDSCNGEEMEFLAWMKETYPEIESSVENTAQVGLFDNDGELLDERYEGYNFWNEYCNS